MTLIPVSRISWEGTISVYFAPAPAGTVYDTTVEIWMADCLDAAKWVQNETEGRTAVLNLANRQTPGGGVFTGSGRGGSYTSSNTGKTRYYDASWTFDDTLHGVHTLERGGLLDLYVLPENARFWRLDALTHVAPTLYR